MFPVDPNAPRVNQASDHRKEILWKRVERILLIISFTISVLGIILAIQSLRISEVSYQASIQQYIESGKSSTAQFDTVAKILADQRKINHNILQTSALQLRESDSLLKQVEALNSPTIVVKKASFHTDTKAGVNNFRTYISAQISNTGRKTLRLISARCYVVDGEKVVGANQILNISHNLTSDYLTTFRIKNYIQNYPVFVFDFDLYDEYNGKFLNNKIYLNEEYVTENEEYTFGKTITNNYNILIDKCSAKEIFQADFAVNNFYKAHKNFKFFNE